MEQEQQKKQELYEKEQSELREKMRAEEEKKRIEDNKTDEDYYLEILPFIHQQEKPVYDSKNRRWVKCQWCEKIVPESKFCSYGGKDRVNLGICYECKNKIPIEQSMVLNIEKTENKNRQIDNTKCPECGEELVEKSGRYGKFMGCKGYPRCKYTRPVRNA